MMGLTRKSSIFPALLGVVLASPARSGASQYDWAKASEETLRQFVEAIRTSDLGTVEDPTVVLSLLNKKLHFDKRCDPQLPNLARVCNKDAWEGGAFAASAHHPLTKRGIWLSLEALSGRERWSEVILTKVLGNPDGRDEEGYPGWVIRGSVLRLRKHSFGGGPPLEYVWSPRSDPHDVIELFNEPSMPLEPATFDALKFYCAGPAPSWAEIMLADFPANPFPVFVTTNGPVLECFQRPAGSDSITRIEVVGGRNDGSHPVVARITRVTVQFGYKGASPPIADSLIAAKLILSKLSIPHEVVPSTLAEEGVAPQSILGDKSNFVVGVDLGEPGLVRWHTIAVIRKTSVQNRGLTPDNRKFVDRAKPDNIREGRDR